MMVKAGATVRDKFVGIHGFIILQKHNKVKGPQPLLVRLRGVDQYTGALTVLATLVDPQVLARYVVSGGKYVTTVVGAVPNVIPVVAVPPEIVLLDPDTGLAAEYQVVINVNTVDDVAVAVTWT